MANRFGSVSEPNVRDAYIFSYILLILITTMCALTLATDPAQITDFELIGGTGDDENEANPGDMVTFVCNASGDPSPLVSIWRRDRSLGEFWSDEDRYFTLMSEERYGSTTFTKVAACPDNNQYRCKAENTYQGNPYVTFQDMTIGVICPASSCSGTDDPESFEVRLGQRNRLYLCVAVNRFESNYYAASEFLIEKETDRGWEAHSGSEVVLTNYNNRLTQLIVTFLRVNIADLGNFRAVFRPVGNIDNDTYIYFQLTEFTYDVISSSEDTTADPDSGSEGTDGNTNSGQNSNPDSYSFPSTASTVDIALAGFLVLNIVITMCVWLTLSNSRLAKVGVQPA